MDNISGQEILRLLGPSSDRLFFDILLYVSFFFSLIMMFTQGDKALLTTIISAATMLLIVLAKLRVFVPLEFGTFVVNAGIFLLPILVAGMTRAPKSRPPAVLAGIAGAIHFFLFWFLFQFQR
jgi:hypothetical protein